MMRTSSCPLRLDSRSWPPGTSGRTAALHSDSGLGQELSELLAADLASEPVPGDDGDDDGHALKFVADALPPVLPGEDAVDTGEGLELHVGAGEIWALSCLTSRSTT